MSRIFNKWEAEDERILAELEEIFNEQKHDRKPPVCRNCKYFLSMPPIGYSFSRLHSSCRLDKDKPLIIENPDEESCTLFVRKNYDSGTDPYNNNKS